MKWIDRLPADQLSELQLNTKQFVVQHIPYEAIYFDPVWDIMLEQYRSFESPPEFRSESQSITALGIEGSPLSDQMDLVFIIAPLLSTVMNMYQTSEPDFDDLDGIRDAILQHCENLHVPAHVKQLLGEHIAPMLATIFNIGAAHVSGSVTTKSLLVDWCEKDYTIRDGIPEIEREPFSPDEVKTRFSEHIKTYRLYIDERSSGYQIRKEKNKTHQFLEWRVLQPKHEKLLGLILEAFRGQSLIHYRTIIRRVFDKRDSVREFDNGQIRTAFSELNSRLGGILARYYKASKGNYRYELPGQISYCWIRHAHQPSRFVTTE